MLCLSKKTDYALIALGHMAERSGRIVSAREIAGAYQLPLGLLMNILKTLHRNQLLQSTRGVKGGYNLRSNLVGVSLYDLIRMLEGKVEPGCDHDHAPGGRHSNVRGSVQAPVQAVHYKMMQFLHDVALADLILPGRRIDVPIEVLKAAKAPAKPLVASGWRDATRDFVEI
jgi:Rrf2 family protein